MSLNQKDFSDDFVQKMSNRMATSMYKYGRVSDNRLTVDFLQNALARIEKYKLTGNTEWLIDASNFLMMEYELPFHPNAHFRATSSQEAPRLEMLV